jgi:hypothetical protein
MPLAIFLPCASVRPVSGSMNSVMIFSGVLCATSSMSAFAGRDERHFLRGPVGHDGRVVFLLDVGAVLDVQAAHLLAFGTRLVGLELHAQDLAGQALDIVDALGHFHAAALAAATRMDLRLDHPHRAAKLLGGFHRLLHREGRNAARHRHTKIAQDFLALVLVNLHEVSLRSG